MAGQQLGRRLGGIVLIAVATACLLAGVMMLSSGGRATELVSKEGELRRELRQNVKRQRVLGSEVKALIAASQMEAARTQSLVKVPAEDGKIDALEKVVKEQRRLIKYLEKRMASSGDQSEGAVPAAHPQEAARKEADASSSTHQKAVAQHKDSNTEPVHKQAHQHAEPKHESHTATIHTAAVQNEVEPKQASGPDEDVWSKEYADSDDQFNMGTNMAFLGDDQKAQTHKARAVTSAPTHKKSAQASEAPASAHKPATSTQEENAADASQEVQAQKQKAPAQPQAKAQGTSEGQEEEDAKPSLGSFDLAKFANNVDFGTGALGTNVVWMYNDLAKKGPYREVEGNDPNKAFGGDMGNPDEYASGRTSQLMQTQLKLNNPSWNSPFVDPYIPPSNLYIFWGKSSARGTVASQLIGGAGRASSGERVRQILKFGTFAGNHYVDDVSGHGHFLRSLEGQQFAGMSLRCCSTLLVPPMENDLPLYSEHAIISRRIRNFVSNGNTLILTGGDYSSLVFLNKYFHYEVKKTVYDQGPFERLADKHLPADAKGKWNDVAKTLPQSGLSVSSVRKASLPPGAQLIYATPFSTPVFQLTFCEAQIDASACKIATAEGRSCLRDAAESECPALRKQGLACSCGEIVYIGYDFVDNHLSTIGRSVWDATLLAAVAMKQKGKPGPGVFYTTE